MAADLIPNVVERSEAVAAVIPTLVRPIMMNIIMLPWKQNEHSTQLNHIQGTYFERNLPK